MKKVPRGGEVTGLVTVSDSSPGSSFRELDDVFLQTQARIWLGEVLHVRFDEETSMADLIADGELLFQVSKLIYKMLVKKHTELKSSKLHVYERTTSGKSDGKYMPYPKVDSFLKICQILGLTGIDLFSPSDVVERRDTRRVCMCIRSLSIKARSKNLNVPDFDVVTYTIAMPKYVVGGICRNFLEQSRCSSSNSSVSSRGSYRQRTFSGNSDQNQELHYDSDEAESCLTEMECETPISRAQFDQPHSFYLDGSDLLEESVKDKRLPLSDEDHCSENGDEISIGLHRLSVVHMDSSNFSAPIQNGNSEDNPEVISGVNHVSLSGDSWQSSGQDGDLTPELKLATDENLQEKSTEISSTRISDIESSCNPTVGATLDNEFEFEKSEDNFTRELESNFNSPFSDSTEKTRLSREGGGGPDLNCEVISSHFDNELEFEKSEDNFTQELDSNFNSPFSDSTDKSRLSREGGAPDLNYEVISSQYDNELEFERSEDNFTQELDSNFNSPFSDSTDKRRLSRKGGAPDLNCEVISSHYDNELEFEKSEDNFTQELDSNFNSPFSDSTEKSRLPREGGGPDLNCEVISSHYDNELEFEKSEDNFTQELDSNFNSPFCDSTKKSRLLREGGGPDLNSEVISSHFGEKCDGSKSVSQSFTTDTISESTFEPPIKSDDRSLEEISTAREITAGDEVECEEVMNQCEHKLVAPVESEKERTPKEVRHTGHKVITSVAGGITVVGVLLIFLQLRKRSNQRNHVIMLRSKIDKTKEKEETVKRNVKIQKPHAVYPGEWLKI